MIPADSPALPTPAPRQGPPRWRTTVRYRRKPQRKVVEVLTFWSLADTDYEAVQEALGQYRRHCAEMNRPEAVLMSVEVLSRENMQ